MQQPKDAPKKPARKKRTLIYKPYVTGVWASAFAARRGLKLLLYELLFMFLFIIVGGVLTFDSFPLRLIANALVLMACASFLYIDGSRHGESDVAFAEILQGHKDAGKQVAQSDLPRCFHPLKGVFTAACCALPLVLLCAVHAATAQVQSYTLQSLPSWVSAFSGQNDIGAALSYYGETPTLGALDVLRVIVRLLIYPFVNIVGVDDRFGLLMMDKLSPLLVLLIPAGYPLGYLQGRRIRAMVHGDIATDAKKRKRKAAKARRARQQKKPEQLV